MGADAGFSAPSFFRSVRRVDIVFDEHSSSLSGVFTRISVEPNMIAPRAAGSGVGGGAYAGEGSEVVGEVGLIVITASESEFGPGDVYTVMELVDGLLETLDATVKLGWYADVFAKELREPAGA